MKAYLRWLFLLLWVGGPVTAMAFQAVELSKQDEFANSLGMEFVLVPPGVFTSTHNHVTSIMADYTQDDIAMIKIPIDNGLWVAKRETTIKLYRQFLEEVKGKNPDRDDRDAIAKSKSGETWDSPGYEIQDEFSVSFVTIADARAFCRWLTIKDGRYYRLPSAYEWRYIAEADALDFPSNEAFSQHVNFADVSFGREFRQGADWNPERGWEGIDDGFAAASPTGALAAGRLGLFDIHGNVMEWTETELIPYSDLDEFQIDEIGRRVIPQSLRYQICGGAFVFSPFECKLMTNNGWGGSAPGSRLPFLGFRVICVK